MPTLDELNTELGLGQGGPSRSSFLDDRPDPILKLNDELGLTNQPMSDKAWYQRFGGEVQKGFKAGKHQAKASFMDASLNRGVGAFGILPTMALKKLSPTFKKYTDAGSLAAKLEAKKAEDPELQRDPTSGAWGWVGSVLGQAAPAMGAAAAAGVSAGPLAGIMSIGMVEGYGGYTEARQRGVPETQARVIGDITGIINGALEALQFRVGVKLGKKAFQALKAGATAKVADKVAASGGKGLAKEFALGGAKESVIEALQEQAPMWLPMLAGAGAPEDPVGRTGGSALAGATLGLLPGGVRGAVQGLRSSGKGKNLGAAEGDTAAPAVDRVNQPVPEIKAPDVVARQAAEDAAKMEFFGMEGPSEDAKRIVREGMDTQTLASHEQLKVGHDIPKALGMTDKERRDFMVATTGQKSMKNMNPFQAQLLNDALYLLADEAGIVVDMMPSERIFQDPAHAGTPQLYNAEIQGVTFIIEPAALGKQKMDLEFGKMDLGLRKMQGVINKLGGESLRSRMAARATNKPTKSMEKWAGIMDQHEEAPEFLSPEEVDVFNYFRTMTRSIFTRENETRERMGMDPIPYRASYLRHIAEGLADDVQNGKYDISEEIKYWSTKQPGKKIFNPMEMPRAELVNGLVADFSKDVIKATRAMMWTGLREIHLNEPLAFFKQQVDLHKAFLPKKTRVWMEEFIATQIKGQQTRTDEEWNDRVKKSTPGKMINNILHKFGRDLGNRPLTSFLSKLSRLQIHGVMGWRPRQLIRNKFQVLQNLAIYRTRSVMKSYFHSDETLKGLMAESTFLQTYEGLEGLDGVSLKKLADANLKAFQWTATGNVKRAMKVAYYDALELIVKPKYQEYGWADPQRTYTEEKGFLYDSEKAVLIKEMEFGAGVTQYHYIPMAMPAVFRSRVHLPFTRLQSWWMNYFFKFAREAMNRTFKGETGYGKKVPWSRRAGMARYLVIGGAILNTFGYASSYAFGAAPTGIPPLAQLMLGMYALAFSDNERDVNNAKYRMYNALLTFMPGFMTFKDFKKFYETGDIWQLMFYNKGPLFGEGGSLSSDESSEGRTKGTRKKP